jgi:hypothetical protein
MNLEMREAKLMEEQACGLHSFDGRDLSTKLEECCARVARGEDEHVAEAGKLLTLVMRISNALVDLEMLLIQNIPQLLKWLRRS